jgi:quercetin dioxygenase-like cupin family protein
VDDAFFDNYAHAPLVGPNGPARNGGIKLGVLLQGPETFYPAHAHPAGEFYLLLAGSPSWKIGDGHWHRKHPGTLIHHAPEVAHAMETGDAAMLAFYAWYGAIHEPPRFV